MTSRSEQLTKENKRLAEELAALEMQLENQQRSGESEFKRHAARTAKDIGSGIASLPDILALPIEAGRYGYKKVRRALEPEKYKEPQFGKWIPGLGEKFSHAVDEATQGYTVPRTSGERVGSAITQGLATIPGIGTVGKALTMVPKIAKAAPKALTTIRGMGTPTATNIGATAGGAGAAQSYMENAYDPGVLGALASGIAGGVGGAAGLKGLLGAGRFAKAPRNVSAEWIGRATGFEPSLYQKQLELGLTPTISGSSAGLSPTQMDLFLAKMPGSSKRMQEVLQQREAALASMLGVEGDLYEAVKRPQTELAKKGAESLKAKKSAEWEKLTENLQPFEKEALSNRLPVDVSDILKNIKEEYGKGLTSPTEVKRFNKKYAGNVYNDLMELAEESRSSLFNQKELMDLKKRGFSDEIIERMAKEAEANKPTISYGALEDVRSEVLNRKNNVNLTDAEKREASFLYDLLAGKKHNVIEEFGTSTAAKESQEARKMYAKYAADKLGERSLKYYGRQLRKSESDKSAFNKILTNPRYLEVVEQGLEGPEKTILASDLMAELGSHQGKFNITTAHSNLSKLDHKVKEKYLKLWPTEAARRNLEQAMDYIGHNKEKIAKVINASGTAASTNFIDMLKTAGKVATGAALLKPYVAAQAAVPLALGYFGAKGMAKLWTDPLFLQRINKVISARNAKQQAGQLRLLTKIPVVKQRLAQSGSQLVHAKKPLKIELSAADKRRWEEEEEK